MLWYLTSAICKKKSIIVKLVNKQNGMWQTSFTGSQRFVGLFLLLFWCPCTVDVCVATYMTLGRCQNGRLKRKAYWVIVKWPNMTLHYVHCLYKLLQCFWMSAWCETAVVTCEGLCVHFIAAVCHCFPTRPVFSNQQWID